MLNWWIGSIAGPASDMLCPSSAVASSAKINTSAAGCDRRAAPACTIGEAIDIPEPRRHAEFQKQDQQDRGCADRADPVLPADQRAHHRGGHQFRQHTKAEAHRLPEALAGKVAFRLALSLFLAIALRPKIVPQFVEARLQFIGFVQAPPY